MAEEPSQQKRRGKAVKPKRGVPAEFQPGDAAAPKVFDADKVAKELHLWWEEGCGETFILGMKPKMVAASNDNDGDLLVEAPQVWSRWPQKKVLNLLKMKWVRQKAREGQPLGDMDQVFTHVMINRRLELVLKSLSGYPAGIYDFHGQSTLVRISPKLLEPKRGEWPFVKQLLHAWLDLSSSDGPDQTVYFHGWMKTALEGLYLGGPGNFRPGQAPIFAGRADCGKSRIQHQIITGLLGARSANPGPFMFSRTEFNEELFEAEHLLIEDPANSTKTVDRVYFGEMLKQLVVNDTQRLHAKRADAITVSPFFRLTISVNDDPDKMRVLPLLTPDMKDKVMLFQVSGNAVPLLPAKLEDRQQFRERVAAELPAYTHWLLNEFEIPAGLRSGRFGVKEWHHPSLALELFDDTPAAELLTIIDAAEFMDSSHVSKRLWELESHAKPMMIKGELQHVIWEGSALDLERLLLGEMPELTCTVMREAKKLFMHNKIDRLLSRLKEDQDHRVAHHRTKLERRWRISRPGE